MQVEAKITNRPVVCRGRMKNCESTNRGWVDKGKRVIYFNSLSENRLYLCESCAYEIYIEIQNALGAKGIAKGKCRNTTP